MSSCYDDLSETADGRFDEMFLNNGIQGSSIETVIAFFGDRLRLDPQLAYKSGMDSISITDNNNLSYEWRLSQFASNYDTLTNVIGTERVLDTIVNMVGPNTYTYYLFLRVTDNETQIKRLFNWDLQVLSVYGQGLLIAETDDEATTDISLLMSTAYNENFGKIDTAIVKRNIYSLANGDSGLDGVASQIAYLSYGTNKSIYAVVKDEHFYGIDPLSMQLQNVDLDFFHFPPRVFKPKSVQADYGAVYLNNDGDMHMFQMRMGQKLDYISSDSPYDYSENFIYHSGNYYYSSHYKGPFIAFDNNKGSFMGLNNYGATTPYLSNTNGVFDPTDIQDREFIAGGPSPNYSYRMLMKSTTSDDYYVYELSREDPAVAKKPIGKAIYDLSNCPGLKNATSFAFGEDTNEFYYAVGNELRVAILDVPNPTPAVSYAVPSGETITHLDIPASRDWGYTTWGEDIDSETGEMAPVWRDSYKKLITAVSYDAGKKEGFIRTLPIEFAGSGGIAAEEYVKTYGGFSRITAIIYKN